MMASTKIAVRSLLLLISGWPRIISAFCNLGYTNLPLDGFYCDGQGYKPPHGVTQASCVHACIISPSCTTMSYNPVTSACLLAKQPCVKAERHADFMLMVFRELEHVDCVVWVRDQSGVVPDRMLTGPHDAQVGMVTVGNDLLVGQAYAPGRNWKTFIALNGHEISFPNEDLLTVHPNCSVAWIPYKVSDVLPPKSVVTGMLANGCCLYSTLHWHAAGYWRIGYYVEGGIAAYYATGGSNSATEFDILVSV